MLSARLASEAFVRHLARNAVSSTEVVTAGPSTISTPLRSYEALNLLRGGSRASYATQAGQPMPPTPPSGMQNDEKSDNRDATAETVSAASDSSAIPSSRDADIPLASTSKSIKPISSIASQYLDMTEIPAGAEERQRTGARSTLGKKAESSSDRRRRAYARSALVISLFGTGAFAWHLGRDWESEREKLRVGRQVTEESGMQGRLQRAQARLIDMSDYFNKPAWEPLIPEPLPPPHQKPYTLLLSLDDLLIHSDWSRDHGWRTAKRPGVDYFIQYMSQFYEIVLFTSQPFYTAAPIVEKLDPFGLYMPYKLFRDCTRYTNKEIVKDLSYLGRDLKKVVMLDTDPQHFRLQPENAIQMTPWKGGSTDRDLVGMIPFLEALAIYQVPDVRPVLQRYSGKHIPTAWAEVEAEQKRAVIEEWEKTKSSVKGKIGSGFGGLFGVSNPQVRHDSGPPKTQLEREREIYQRAYQDEQKYWVDNKSILENARKEDEEKQKEAMGKSVFSFVAAQMGLVPPPDPNTPAGSPQTQQAK